MFDFIGHRLCNKFVGYIAQAYWSKFCNLAGLSTFRIMTIGALAIALGKFPLASTFYTNLITELLTMSHVLWKNAAWEPSEPGALNELMCPLEPYRFILQCTLYLTFPPSHLGPSKNVPK